ncbi:GAP family protein [Cumulibacter soli]|uniref:GAP family protein n=1 Tax=Cumulibacter soli TaxID=2546344 RepID=UPI001067BC00|nr:GAP family protein [Cumulibacter soli]
MNAVIADLLPLAVGVAVSPIPIIAVILMLLSTHPGPTSGGFALGWIVGIALTSTAMALMYNAAGAAADEGSSGGGGWFRLILGLLLIALAVRKWRARPTDADAPQLPHWMSAVTQFGVAKATGLGLVLSSVNPKNLLMAVAAGTVIADGVGGADEFTVAVAVYTVIAASTVLIPVIGYAVAAARVRPWLDALRGWLEANNAAMMAVLLLVLGVMILGKGIAGLG